MTSLNKFKPLLLRHSAIFWLLGLYIVNIYTLYFLSLTSFKKSILRDKLIIVLIFILFIQVVSLMIGPIFHDYYTISRTFAMIHNIVVYSFLFAGYNLAKQANISLKNAFPKFLMSFILLVITTFVISTYLKHELSYGGLLSFISDNKYTTVSFNRMGWTWLGTSPRSEVFGIYSNSTALLLFLTYVISAFYTRIRKRISILVLICLFTIGSRSMLFFGVITVLIYHIKSKHLYLLFVFMMPLFILAIVNLIPVLSEMRQGSNDTRMAIYTESLRLTLDTNFILGLGIKPILPGIVSFQYPVGSHSTLLGYFIKNGMIGGALVLTLYVSAFYFSLRYFANTFFKSVYKYNHRDFFLVSSFLCLLIISLAEDLDSYEPIMLFVGILLYNFKKALFSHKKHSVEHYKQ
ncbi:O-antigen ligase family protein [Fulvivirga sp.]|uniref:O-antigen ligase family protein n=1 Tax=Fulvivirga sp. TaxID=1931237 RepID=UPI0032EF5851